VVFRPLYRPSMLSATEVCCSSSINLVSPIIWRLQGLEAVLAETLSVIPDDVLDAPPPVLDPSESPLLLKAPLPQLRESSTNADFGLDVRIGGMPKELASEREHLVAGAA
jgi:hypothetical protein